MSIVYDGNKHMNRYTSKDATLSIDIFSYSVPVRPWLTGGIDPRWQTKNSPLAGMIFESGATWGILGAFEHGIYHDIPLMANLT